MGCQHFNFDSIRTVWPLLERPRATSQIDEARGKAFIFTKDGLRPRSALNIGKEVPLTRYRVK
jgi:hypothetical protein